VEFAWDHAKHERTRRERGFGFDYGEERIRAIGEIDGRVHVVIYTDRPGTRWIISAWKASGKDVRTWRSSRE